MYLPKSYYGWASSIRLHRGNSFTAETIPLDVVCKGFSKIKLVKIDAEGAEYHILQGAQETLRKTKCVILEHSKDTEEILLFLREASFNIHKLKFTTHIYAEKI